MRAKLIVLLIFVISTLNYGVYQKEHVRRYGDKILLKTVPSDPRSLMQGDYMVLQYELSRTIKIPESYNGKDGYIVVRPNEYNVAEFVRFYSSGEALSDGEKLLFFRNKRNHVGIFPDTFLFQEGHGRIYSAAKYAIFMIDNLGNQLLVGLADVDRNEIIVKK